MRGLLLDTHAALWYIEGNAERMPQATRARIETWQGDVAISAVSLWEIAIKHRQGKLPLPVPLSEWPTLLFITGVHLINIDPAHVLADLDPVPDTKDPFDRLLLATAAVERLRLATIDTALLDHPLAWCP